MFSALLCLGFSESMAVSVSLLPVAAVLLAVSLRVKRMRQTLIIPTALCGIVTACLLFSLFQGGYNKTVANVGNNLAVSGVIAEGPEFSRENCRYYLVIKADRVGGVKVKTKMRVSFSETYDGIDPSDLQIGDRVSFIGTVYKAGNASASSRRSYKSRGIYLGAHSVGNLTSENPLHRPISYYMDIIRQRVTEMLMHDFDNENASLMVAVLTGNKDYLEEEMYDDFIEAGIVHIMAVSGLHLSVWVVFLSLFIDFTGKKGKLKAVAMIVFTVFMMNFASFTGSVKRAAAMTVLYFIGKLLGKKPDSLNSLGFAAVCALSLNPFGVLDVSFLLSFLSTMGIILMGVPLSEKITGKLNVLGDRGRKIVSALAGTVVLSVSVAFFVFPVSVLILGGVSFVSPLTNLFCFVAVTPLLLMTGLYPFLRLVPVISPFMAIIMKYLSSYIIRVADFASQLPFSYVDTDFEKLGIWFLSAFALLLAAMLLYNYSRVLMKVAAIMSAGIFLLSFSVNFYTSLDKCKITVYGDGRGSCAVAVLNGRGVLIGFDGDIYDEREIKEDAERDRVKIDTAFFTEDFISKDKESLCRLLGVENILTCDGEGAVLFGKVTIRKEGKNVTVDSSVIKTEIFLKEHLQDADKYDTIAVSDGKYVFSLGEKNPYTVTVFTPGGERDG